MGDDSGDGRRARDLSDRADAQGLPPGDPLIAVLDQLPGRLTFLSVVDERQSILADMLVGVPNLIDSLPAWEILGFMGFPFAEQLSMVNNMLPGSVVAVGEPTPMAAVPVPSSVPGTVEPPGARNADLTPAFDPELIPEADDLRAFLFPSVSVLAVDDRGIRFISREAFPTINPATALPVAAAMLVPVLNASRVASPVSRVRPTP